MVFIKLLNISDIIINNLLMGFILYMIRINIKILNWHEKKIKYGFTRKKRRV